VSEHYEAALERALQGAARSRPVRPVVHHYCTEPLRSPDGRYAAYSRVQLGIVPHNPTQSYVSSVLFVENLETGNAQLVLPQTSLARNPFASRSEPPPPGTIALVVPAQWSVAGDRLLAREFESYFSAAQAADYAVIWRRSDRTTTTLSPRLPSPCPVTHTILKGWSETDPEGVLFQTGQMGTNDWPLWIVMPDGVTHAADRAVGDWSALGCYELIGRT
jgi:hypothetical protein